MQNTSHFPTEKKLQCVLLWYKGAHFLSQPYYVRSVVVSLHREEAFACVVEILFSCCVKRVFSML